MEERSIGEHCVFSCPIPESGLNVFAKLFFLSIFVSKSRKLGKVLREETLKSFKIDLIFIAGRLNKTLEKKRSSHLPS